MKAARSPRERPHRTPGPRGRVSQQRRRSPEPDCPHRSSPPGTRETASSARDRSPQQSASSDPSANRGGIIQRESNNSVRFHTTRVIFVRSARSRRSRDVRFAPIASELSHHSESTRCARRRLLQRSKYLYGGSASI